jgi:hypothetical protein
VKFKLAAMPANKKSPFGLGCQATFLDTVVKSEKRVPPKERDVSMRNIDRKVAG